MFPETEEPLHTSSQDVLSVDMVSVAATMYLVLRA